MGDTKDGIAEDMDSLTEQTGIPFVHIDASVVGAPEAYRMLGELTGQTEKAEELASWCEDTYAMMTAMMEKVDADGTRKSVLYCLGDKGLNVIAKGSYHAETVNLMTNNLADLPEVVSSGLGNEVDMEQLLVWDPDVIIFAPDTIYDTVGRERHLAAAGRHQQRELLQDPLRPLRLAVEPSLRPALSGHALAGRAAVSGLLRV